MARRSLEDWAHIAEIVASVAVVLSLLYVAYEVRQNRIALQANTRQQFAVQDLQYLATALDPSLVASALSKLDEGRELTPVERSQLVNRQHMNFRVFENAHYQYRIGTLEAGEWDRYDAIIESLLCAHQPAQVMWSRFTFTPEFTEEVEAIRRRCF